MIFSRIEDQVVYPAGVFTIVKPWFRKRRYFLNEMEIPKEVFIQALKVAALRAIREKLREKLKEMHIGTYPTEGS